MQQFLEFLSNHPLMFAALAAVLVALVINELHGNLRGAKRLSPADVVRLINDQDAVVLDVRTGADFKKGHLLGAVNIPVNRIAERHKELGKDRSRPVVAYCALGSAAPAATDQLAKLGFESVYVLKGGINNWQQAGMPVTTKS